MQGQECNVVIIMKRKIWQRPLGWGVRLRATCFVFRRNRSRDQSLTAGNILRCDNVSQINLLLTVSIRYVW